MYAAPYYLIWKIQIRYLSMGIIKLGVSLWYVEINLCRLNIEWSCCLFKKMINMYIFSEGIQFQLEKKKVLQYLENSIFIMRRFYKKWHLWILGCLDSR